MYYRKAPKETDGAWPPKFMKVVIFSHPWALQSATPLTNSMSNSSFYVSRVMGPEISLRSRSWIPGGSVGFAFALLL